tara:strand:- start:315 stop:515 length:201 start_codon:yes stop_codon:yes gene_type:complete
MRLLTSIYSDQKTVLSIRLVVMAQLQKQRKATKKCLLVRSVMALLKSLTMNVHTVEQYSKKRTMSQ